MGAIMRLLPVALLICCIAALTAGCATPPFMDPEVVGQIRVGQTTQGEVASLLGPPNLRNAMTVNGRSLETWAYGYGHVQATPLTHVPLVNLFLLAFTGPKVRSHGLGITFSNGVVQALSSSATAVDSQGFIGGTRVQSDHRTLSGTPGASLYPDLSPSMQDASSSPAGSNGPPLGYDFGEDEKEQDKAPAATKAQ